MDQELKVVGQLQQAVIAAGLQFGPKLLVALVLVVAGFFVSRWVSRIADRGLLRFGLEPPAQALLVRIMWGATFVLFAIMALQNMGVQLLPLVAGLGVAGAGVALAMQGVLGNIMAGLTIIFTKPFRIGEYVSMAGEEGQVAMITLSSTILLHPDLSQVVIPNRKIVGEILHNYGTIRQLEITIGVVRNADLNHILGTVTAVLHGNPRCLREPAPLVGISGFGEGAITITAKPWVAVADVGTAAGEIRKAIVEAFRGQEIIAPPPQREVTMLAQADRRGSYTEREPAVVA
jgi:small conductance mechanosensitive channel